MPLPIQRRGRERHISRVLTAAAPHDGLAVVEHEQHASVRHESGDGLEGRLEGRLPHAEHAGNGGGHRRRVVDGGQLHEGDSVGMMLGLLGGGVHG